MAAIGRSRPPEIGNNAGNRMAAIDASQSSDPTPRKAVEVKR